VETLALNKNSYGNKLDVKGQGHWEKKKSLFAHAFVNLDYRYVNQRLK